MYVFTKNRGNMYLISREKTPKYLQIMYKKIIILIFVKFVRLNGFFVVQFLLLKKFRLTF